MKKISQELKTKLDNLPAKPGVYLMKDTGGRVIYVGKAKVLRNRVRSYFQNLEAKDPKTRILIRHIDDLDYIIVGSEAEAFIAENSLIKKHHPRYNIQLRDDKNYLCVRLSVQDDFPRIYLVRRIRKDKSRYFGPYASARSLRETLAILNKFFPLRKCTDQQFGQRTRPCLMHQIGRCLGPCCGLVSKEDYHVVLSEVALFLEGRNKDLLKILKERMAHYAEELRFEEAGLVRDQIIAVEKTLEKQQVVTPALEDQDAIGLYREGGKVELAVLFVRGGKMLGSRNFSFGSSRLDDEEIIGSFIGQFYADDRFIPSHILSPIDFEQRKETTEFLRGLAGKAVHVSIPQRGDRLRLVETAKENAKAYFKSRARRAEDTESTLEKIERALHLSEYPEVIDCFDISNLGGTLTVASKVRFRNGKPDKSGYRRYRIKTAKAGDDYGSMYEVLTRWTKSARKEGEFPNLVLLDGGKGQLSMAMRVFSEMEYIQSDLATIAKPSEEESTDKFFIPGRKNPVVFKHGSNSLYLLQRVRDEAHRFAIEYNRKLRGRSNLRSAIEDVPGVGKTRRTLLLKTFGSMKKLREASHADIEAVKGISKNVADAVFQYLHPEDAEDKSERK